MNKTSIQRIFLTLSTLVVPFNIILIIGIMIGGGFRTDSNGLIFWGIVLIFLISVIFLILSWKKLKKLSMDSLLFSIITLILSILPITLVMILV